jgi:predicted GNAT family acetyltransferase
MNEPAWKKLKKKQIAEAEAFLKYRERWCMNACYRFIRRESLKIVWTVHDRAGNMRALIVHSKQSLLPVFSGGPEIPPLYFLRNLFGAVPLHSIQGRREDAEILEAALEKAGYQAAEKFDYDLMCLDKPPRNFQSAGPSTLVIRKPQPADMDALAELHAAYEMEEVLPSRSQFNAAVSRLNAERIFQKEQMLVAELGGRLVGKINTNALAFTRYQVGGVYVHPDCRGLGIARRMAGEFAENIIPHGGISLFVKKSNPAARRVYERIGFEAAGGYRISYY